MVIWIVFKRSDKNVHFEKRRDFADFKLENDLSDEDIDAANRSVSEVNDKNFKITNQVMETNGNLQTEGEFLGDEEAYTPNTERGLIEGDTSNRKIEVLISEVDDTIGN